MESILDNNFYSSTEDKVLLLFRLGDACNTALASCVCAILYEQRKQKRIKPQTHSFIHSSLDSIPFSHKHNTNTFSI